MVRSLRSRCVQWAPGQGCRINRKLLIVLFGWVASFSRCVRPFQHIRYLYKGMYSTCTLLHWNGYAPGVPLSLAFQYFPQPAGCRPSILTTSPTSTLSELLFFTLLSLPYLTYTFLVLSGFTSGFFPLPTFILGRCCFPATALSLQTTNRTLPGALLHLILEQLVAAAPGLVSCFFAC